MAVVVISEFLEDVAPGLDVGRWRTHAIFEPPHEVQDRVETTAASLERIGAHSAAAAVRSATSSSPIDALMGMFAGGVPQPGDLRKAMDSFKMVDLVSHLRENLAMQMPRLAREAGIETLQSDPPDAVESAARDEVMRLLERFVVAHQSELQGDIDRHGEARQINVEV